MDQWRCGVNGSESGPWRTNGAKSVSVRGRFNAPRASGIGKAVLGRTIERNQVEVADHSGYGTSTTVRPLIPSKSRAWQVCTGRSFAIAIAAIIAS